MTLSTLILASALAALSPPARAETVREFGPFALVQDDDEPQVVDNREDVAQRIKAFGAHTKKKGKQDPQAIELIDELTRDFSTFGPKDRVAIVKALEKTFKLKRPKLLESGYADSDQYGAHTPNRRVRGVADDRLFYASAMALGEMGPESVKALLGVLGHRTHKGNVRLQARIAKSLGSCADPKAIKALVGLLDHKESALQAAGAQALSNFDGEDLKTRKQLFKKLLDVLVAQKSKKDADSADIEAYERWSRIAGPFIATLQDLSGHDERDADEWVRWWNEKKKKDWDG